MSRAQEQPVRLLAIIPALGIAQIVSWGSLFYAIAVLAEPVRRTLGLGSVEAFAGFSIALGISGLMSPFSGRLIDAHGGRLVLSLGALNAAAALVILATAVNFPMLLAGWCLVGVAMSMTLYDPAFAALGAIAGSRYRQAITALTLIAGFSSTVFWPLTHALESWCGWRNTLLLFALLHVVVALPLVWLLVPPRERPKTSIAPAGQKSPAMSSARSLHGRIWLAACFTLASFVFSSMSAHLVGLMNLKGLTIDQAVTVLSLVGPMQVTGRLLEMSLGRRLTLRTLGTLTFSVLVAALALLAFVPGMGVAAFVFVIVYGGANGVYTIVRGVLPETLYGRERLGSLLGWLARPQYVAQAVAPAAVAFLLRALPANHVIILLCAAEAASLGCFLWAVRVANHPH
ncbi:MAG: MFS transporter [Proteobacteria bacterium]|nr:MAG: MFS transporter [Pseudomonadota bacterium]